MDKIIIIAIDRAEKYFGNACRKFSLLKNVEIDTIMLVNESFAHTPAYKGDETEGLFREIRCDFDDTKNLMTVLNEFREHKVVLHCRGRGHKRLPKGYRMLARRIFAIG